MKKIIYLDYLAKEKGFEDDKKQIGLSAQQVKEVMPEVVHSAPFDTDFDEDGKSTMIKNISKDDYMAVIKHRHTVTFPIYPRFFEA